MDYTKITINCKKEQQEILLAFLSQLPFDTFEEKDFGLLAYIPKSDFTQEEEEKIAAWKKQFGFEWSREDIPAQNWNKVWESDFQPITVGSFCTIRADFHSPSQGVAHDLIVNPKMAFGTGHHETTHMVIEYMEKLDFSEKKVLDFGCGTGVLAILASRCGANAIDAIDYDILSYENTIENLTTNKVSNVSSYHGTLDLLSQNTYDIILANINRNVILEAFKTLYAMLPAGGDLVISGFLQEDLELMKKEAENAGFTVKSVQNRNNWLCLALNRIIL